MKMWDPKREHGPSFIQSVIVHHSPGSPPSVPASGVSTGAASSEYPHTWHSSLLLFTKAKYDPHRSARSRICPDTCQKRGAQVYRAADHLFVDFWASTFWFAFRLVATESVTLCAFDQLRIIKYEMGGYSRCISFNVGYFYIFSARRDQYLHLKNAAGKSNVGVCFLGF